MGLGGILVSKPGLHSVSKAIYDDGVVIKSYTAWSLMDRLGEFDPTLDAMRVDCVM